MASNVRNPTWRSDAKLREDMETYVSRGLRREEILDFLVRDFPQYAWSLRTLDRRLREFDIHFSDTRISVEEVKEAVKNELDGPGCLLGYRAMRNKLRQEYKLNVPRDLVYNVMFDLDPDGLVARGPTKRNKKVKGHFTTKGVNWVHSMDGHDKLMGYQNRTFPLAVYGSTDTASRKLLWLRVWVTNSDPGLIGRWYLEYLYESRKLPSIIRVDRGSETGIMATMQAFLRQNHGDIKPTDTVVYGPSTANQVDTIYKNFLV